MPGCKPFKSPATRFTPLSLHFAAITIFSVFLSLPACLHAAQVTLAWDANREPVAGYRLYYGHTSRNYQSTVDAGNRTSYTWSGLADGKTYYFAATAYDAYNNQSDYSEELVCHTIVPSAQTGGSISPANTVFVTSGGRQTFTITPAQGYQVSQVWVNGQSVGAVTRYEFEGVSAPGTISAVFAPVAPTVYTITASVSGGGGSILPSGTIQVSAGGSRTFTITPADGYRVGDVVVNGKSQGAVTSYDFTNVVGNGTITASFVPVTYTITASVSGGGGSISPSGTVQVSAGGSRTFTITPADGYRVGDVVVNGKSQGAVTSYDFKNVVSNGTITASFVPITYTITASVSGGGGSISPSGTVQVNAGGSQTFTITPAADHEIAALLVDGKSVTPSKTYTFESVTGNRTLTVSFKPIQQKPVADAGPDQRVAGGALVTLRGGNSTTAANGVLSYLWQQVDGKAVKLSNPQSPNPTFKAPSVGTRTASLAFRLTVTDGSMNSASDICIVNVSTVNAPPVADAGQDQTVDAWTHVTLDGSKSRDSDGSIVAYSWKQIQGPPVQILDANRAQASIVVPELTAAGDSMVFELTVTDNTGLRSTDACVVNVSWSEVAPVAEAGPDFTVYAGDLVVLDGMDSFDDDGIVSYRWKQLQGVPVGIADPTAPILEFTAPAIAGTSEVLVFGLMVTDRSGLQTRDTCRVTIQKKAGVDLSGVWLSSSYDGTTLRSTLQLANHGTMPAGGFTVSFYLSGNGATAGNLLKTVPVRAMAGGSVRNLSFTYRNKNLAGQSVVAAIDSTGVIQEWDKANNTASLIVVQTLFRDTGM